MATDFSDAGAETTRMRAVVSDAWRAWLHARLAGRATPVVQFPDVVRSAASLWSGARGWTHALRAAGVTPGDVVVSALPAGPAVLQLLIASLWDGLSLVVVPAAATRDETALLAERHDARLVVHDRHDVPASARGLHRPAAGGWPDDALPVALHPARAVANGAPVLGDAAGTRQTYVALLGALRDDAGARDLMGGRVLVSVRWSDADMLARGVLLPLLVSDELFVVPPTDPSLFARVLEAEPITHVIVEAGVDTMPLPRALGDDSPTVISLERAATHD